MSSSAPDQLPPPKPVGFNASYQRVHRPRAAAPGIVVLAEPVQSAHQQGPAASATIPPRRSASSNVTDADHRMAATSHEPPISSASSHGKRKRDEHDTTAKADPGEHGKTVKAEPDGCPITREELDAAEHEALLFQRWVRRFED